MKMLADDSMAITLRQSRAYSYNANIRLFPFSTRKSLIDPLSLFSYNPSMQRNHYFLPPGGFYRPDHDPPLAPRLVSPLSIDICPSLKEKK